MYEFLVVAWDYYYPDAGLGNIKDSFHYLPEAQHKAHELAFTYDRVEIYRKSDLSCIEVVK